MKKVMIGFIVYLTAVFAASSPISPKEEGALIEIPGHIGIKEIPLMYENFIDSVGHRESRNDYSIVNKLGYLGRYQFGLSTLKTIKIKTSRAAFLQDSVLQDSAMLLNLKYNKKRLQKYIDKYSGTIINDSVVITESGILAAAHLSGQGNVKKYFKRGKNPRDKFGTSLENYLIRFSGYNLELDE